MIPLKAYKPLPKLEGFSFDQQTIINYRNSNKILCMRMSLTYRCNLDCKYCYTKELRKDKNEAVYSDFIDVVNQGINLGLKSVVLLGGEPLIYPHLFDFLEYLSDNKIASVIFTNGTLITEDIAKKLYELNVSVLIKFDGYKDTQDFLAGFGTFEKIQRALVNLMRVGYNRHQADSLKLGCASVVTNINIKEMTGLWKFFRNNNIFPHVEKMTITNGNASLAPSTEKLRELFCDFKEIDEKIYGIRWDGPSSNIAAHHCSILFAGCHVDPYLGVSLCPEIPPIENLRKVTLKDVILTEYFQKARNVEKYIKGKCSSCRYLTASPCHGCRSKVLRTSGDLFDEDKECEVYENYQN